MTGEEKYRKAAALLRQQLRLQPRTASGGFWHKKIYPFQMWLDGLYMAHPFSTLYAAEFGDTAAYEDIARQIHLTERNLRDSVTGLYYHGWDESKSQRWANPKTGRSPNFWGRSIGWFAMALTDVLEIFPGDHPRRTDLERIFKDLARSILAHREQATGLWYQVMDKPGKTGNYRETSASAMFTYALAKGARLGYLNPDAGRTAEESFRGIIRHLVRIGDDGIVHLPDVCKVSGLGGSPYRDGSYEYYVGEARRTDDFKGYGPFLLAAIEIERLTAGPAADRDRGSGERSLK
jgi:unsaturated rhamnogalacturonyl hydrolase